LESTVVFRDRCAPKGYGARIPQADHPLLCRNYSVDPAAVAVSRRANDPGEVPFDPTQAPTRDTRKTVGPKQTEGPGITSEAFPLFVSVRCRTGEVYADVFTPAIQVWAMEATEQ
jgi:hypothetical protein